MPWPKGKLFSLEQRQRLAMAMLGNTNGVGHRGRGGVSSHRKGCSCGWHRTGKCGAAARDWKGAIKGAGPGWKAARKMVWARDKVCRACGLPPHPKRRLDVHHIEDRNGENNQLENLLGLHHGCHMKAHAGKTLLPSLAVGQQPLKLLGPGSNPAPGTKPT